jgi:hypothetical protein
MTEHARTAARNTMHTSSVAGMCLQRKCACGTHTAGGGECANCAKEGEAVQRKARRDDAGAEAPDSVHEVLRSPGRPLDASALVFMEPRFGQDFSRLSTHHAVAPMTSGRLLVGGAQDPLERAADAASGRVVSMSAPRGDARQDFSGVRIHTDEAAVASVRELNARAYTVGNHIAFDAGEYSPGTAAGRQLLAHELTHTIQQSQTGVALQRFVPCTRARMSLEDCPQRDAGEDAQSRAEPMILEYITSPEPGYLVANFDIGKSAVKAGLQRHPLWPGLLGAVSEAKSQWQMIGLSDCHGETKLNESLRKQRADAVLATMPPAVAAHVVGTTGASLTDCVTDNGNRIAREWNRAVLITPVSREFIFEPDPIHGKRPVPKPVEQDTVDCNQKQKDAIAQAQPIAVDMIRTALLRLRDRSDPKVKAWLRDYFADDGTTTYEHVHDGLINTLQGLSREIKVECESAGSLFYSQFCETGSVFTIGYAYAQVGTRVHLCEAAFGQSDIDLASTLVHECSHLYDLTDDKVYCWKSSGKGCSMLSPKDAYDNADSYANFARSVYLNP